MIRPPPLTPGDTVALVAPSSPFDAALFEQGVAWLSLRYRVQVPPDILSRAGFLAGDDLRRRAELAAALTDPSAKAIVAARGGYGATRFVHDLDYSALRAAPRWLVGFSDVTALHVEATRAGVMSIHGAMVASLGGADPEARQEWIDLLEGRPAPRWTGLTTVCEGSARGQAFGGNLSLIEACASAGRLAVPKGSILFLEDCAERPYRVDRMLTSLLVGGHLREIAGVVIGAFSDCGPGKDGVLVEAVLGERLSGLGVPVVRGAPFGHAGPNRPFVVGGPCALEAGPSGAQLSFPD